MDSKDVNNATSTNNTYPIYNDGNILKSSDLNQSFDFLHTQLKSTRNLLFGQGIVSGLNCNYSDSKITISGGVAVTRSGSIVEMKDDSVYDRCVAVKSLRKGTYDNSFPEEAEYILIEEGNEDNINEVKTIRQLVEEANIEEYILAIQVAERLEGAQKCCTLDSCTYSADKVVLECIPVLIRKNRQEAADADDGQMADLAYMPPIEVKVQRWADYNILPVFLRQATNHFYEETVGVANNMSIMTKYMQELQTKYFTYAKILEEKDYDAITRLGTMEFDNRYVATYLSFAGDMVDAANEWISRYNQFLHYYRLLEVQQGSKFDDVIILGGVHENANTATDRNSFQTHYQDSGRTQDESILVRMYNRMLLMIDNFRPERIGESEDIKFIPANNALPLGERLIPKYYCGDSLPDLKDCWDAHHPYHEEQVKADAESTDEDVTFGINDYRRADCFQLFGYEDVFADTVKAKLHKEIRDKNLPVIVLEHKLEGDDSSYRLEQYNPNVKEPVSGVSDIVSTLMGESILYADKSGEDRIFGQDNDDNRKRISAALVAIMNACADEESYVDIAKASDILKNLGKDIGESKIEEIRQAIYLMALDEKKPLSVSQKRKLEYLLLVIFYHYNPDMLKACCMPGVDYIGGVEKKDVLLLVTFNKKTVACLNMPNSCLSICGDRYKVQLAAYNASDATGNISSILGFETLEQTPDYPKFDPENKADFYDVYMLHYGRNKDDTANYFRMLDGRTKTAAEKLISKQRVLVFEHVKESEAKDIAYLLNEGYKACILIVPEGKSESSNKQLCDMPDCQYADIEATLIDDDEKMNELLNVFKKYGKLEEHFIYKTKSKNSETSKSVSAKDKLTNEKKTSKSEQETGNNDKITLAMKQVDKNIFLQDIKWKGIDAVLEIKSIY